MASAGDLVPMNNSDEGHDGAESSEELSLLADQYLAFLDMGRPDRPREQDTYEDWLDVSTGYTEALSIPWEDDAPRAWEFLQMLASRAREDHLPYVAGGFESFLNRHANHYVDTIIEDARPDETLRFYLRNISVNLNDLLPSTFAKLRPYLSDTYPAAIDPAAGVQAPKSKRPKQPKKQPKRRNGRR